MEANEKYIKIPTKILSHILLRTEREVGHVDPRIYLDWAKAGGGIFIGLLILIAYTVDQGVSISSKWCVFNEENDAQVACMLTFMYCINFIS